jgi:SHS2 domain-containing protein
VAFSLLEHTADMGLDVSAASREELFAEAARALLHLLGGDPAAREKETLTLEIVALEQDELLVNWLNEILFLLETRHFYPAEATIDACTSTRLCARLSGETLVPGRHTFARDAKAVTYHKLILEQRATDWHARIYVDL